MKTCSHCKKQKAAQDFYADKSKADGRSSRCISCAKFRAKVSRNNRDKRFKTYHGRPCRSCGATEKFTANRSCVSCVREADRLRSKAPEKRDYLKAWVQSNREKIAVSHRAYRKRKMECPKFRATQTVRKMLWRSVSEGRSLSRLPYTVEDLMMRMECQFQPGMSWANYGDWEIDHKLPVKWFIDRGETRAHVINALSNLQPLWSSDNRSKGARLEWQQRRCKSLAS